MNAIEVVQALTSATNTTQWDAMGALLTDDFAGTGLAPMTLGKHELIGGEQAWHAASPDRHISVGNASDQGGGVTATLTITGTQTNTLSLPDLPAMPATGKSYTITGNATITLRGEQVAALAFDQTSPDVFEQLGVQLPPA